VIKDVSVIEKILASDKRCISIGEELIRKAFWRMISLEDKTKLVLVFSKKLARQNQPRLRLYHKKWNTRRTDPILFQLEEE